MQISRVAGLRTLTNHQCAAVGCPVLRTSDEAVAWSREVSGSGPWGKGMPPAQAGQAEMPEISTQISVGIMP